MREDEDQGTERDKAKDKGAMGLLALERLVGDIQFQPQWRLQSDKCADYYDGWQLSASRIAEMEDAGMPVSVTNLIGRAVNSALGMEAKNRLNWKLSSDDDAFLDVAAALNTKLAEAQRETYADMAMSDAYRSQLIAGVGFCEVSRNPDPLEYPYRVEEIHRNEIWWDWRARRKDLKDARWMVRQRWIDLDEALDRFPDHAQQLEWSLGAGPMVNALHLDGMRLKELERGSETARTFRVSRDEWFDGDRKRVRMYEVWYKVPKRMTVMVMRDGRRLPFNAKNPAHAAAAANGLVELLTGPSYEIRQALYAGPFRLMDRPTERRSYPYIPFWCYRTDRDRAPYGIVDGMISPQEEYNERRSKLLWLLRTAQVIVDDDALSTKYNNFLDLAREAMRPDATIILNPHRRNANGLQINHQQSLAAEQVSVMGDAKQLIQEVPGIFGSMMGDGPTGASGLAINSLVEQSLVALGETNDNYRMGRRLVGEALVELMVEDMQRPDMQISVGYGKSKRVVVLNTFDPEDQPVNHVKAAPLKTALEDLPSTPAARMQQQQEVGKVLQSVGNDQSARAVLVPAFIEATDLPGKDEMAQWLRQQTGVPQPGETDRPNPEAEAMRKEALEMQKALADAELKNKIADAAYKMTQAELNAAKVMQIKAEVNAANEDEMIASVMQEALA